MGKNNPLKGPGEVRVSHTYPEADLPEEPVLTDELLSDVVESLALHSNEESERLIKPLSQSAWLVHLFGEISLNYADLSPEERNRQIIPILDFSSAESIDETLQVILNESAQYRDTVAE